MISIVAPAVPNDALWSLIVSCQVVPSPAAGREHGRCAQWLLRPGFMNRLLTAAMAIGTRNQFRPAR